MLADELKSIKGEILIYGAHLVAMECARWLIQNGKRNQLAGFAVTDMNGNPEELAGFPVKNIEDYKDQSQACSIVIAMPEKYHDAVETYARTKGFCRFWKVSLEEMSRIKGRRLLSVINNDPLFPFALEEDKNDISWLNMFGQASVSSDCERIKECHYKFPTLFYLDEKKVFAEAAKFHFEEEYQKICGPYRNLHRFPVKKPQNITTEELRNTIRIYMAFSRWDSTKPEERQEQPWIRPLQVGSKQSDRRYGELFDDTGDHISGQNSLFAEMTGAYWIWKNEPVSRYKGLCHYRRHFMLSEEEILSFDDNGIDVILTTPRYVPGGIKNMFLAETPMKDAVYQSMLCAISELRAEDRAEFERYMEGCLYYPNNMVVAKREIYDSYCDWMFPILFRMLEIDIETGYGHTKDRHIAYAAELLTSYYFVKEKDKYRITVTDYRFYS